MQTAASFKTREEWLNHMAGALRPVFDGVGASLPRNVRIAIGFPSHGAKGKRIGECWDSSASADGTFEILIRPDQADPTDACAILAHELVHAAVGLAAGHGPAFRKVAKGIGLKGKMTATTAGPGFVDAITPLLAAAGPMPHARLNFDGVSNKPKKQTSRLIKCECATCGYNVRTARKWIEEKGAPHCPEHGVMTAELPDEDELDEEGEG